MVGDACAYVADDKRHDRIAGNCPADPPQLALLLFFLCSGAFLLRQVLARLFPVRSACVCRFRAFHLVSAACGRKFSRPAAACLSCAGALIRQTGCGFRRGGGVLLRPAIPVLSHAHFYNTVHPKIPVSFVAKIRPPAAIISSVPSGHRKLPRRPGQTAERHHHACFISFSSICSYKCSAKKQQNIMILSRNGQKVKKSLPPSGKAALSGCQTGTHCSR